jgi:hypothetical protein
MARARNSGSHGSAWQCVACGAALPPDAVESRVETARLYSVAASFLTYVRPVKMPVGFCQKGRRYGNSSAEARDEAASCG